MLQEVVQIDVLKERWDMKCEGGYKKDLLLRHYTQSSLVNKTFYIWIEKGAQLSNPWLEPCDKL